jgi:hypothetical protein
VSTGAALVPHAATIDTIRIAPKRDEAPTPAAYQSAPGGS